MTGKETDVVRAYPGRKDHLVDCKLKAKRFAKELGCIVVFKWENKNYAMDHKGKFVRN